MEHTSHGHRAMLLIVGGRGAAGVGPADLPGLTFGVAARRGSGRIAAAKPHFQPRQDAAGLVIRHHLRGVRVPVAAIALGLMFLIHVATRLAMPDFDAALLALLGISAGTYVGLKIPEGEGGAGKGGGTPAPPAPPAGAPA